MTSPPRCPKGALAPRLARRARLASGDAGRRRPRGRWSIASDRDARDERRDGGADEGAERSPWLWLVPLGLLAAAGLAYALLPGFRSFANELFGVLTSGDQDRIQGWVQGFGPWGLAVLVGILVLQPFLIVVPSAALMIVAVLAYGPLQGGLLAWGGMILSAVVGYGIGRAFGPVTVDRLLGHDTEQKMEGYLEDYGFWAVLLFRISPVLSTDAISVAAGLVEMRFGRYLLATAVGLAPLAAVIAFAGESFDRLERFLIWGSLASIAMFAGYVIWDRRRSGGA